MDWSFRTFGGTITLRIVLISPKGPLYRHRGGIFTRGLRYAPLTLITLASLVPDDVDAEITLVDEGIEEVDHDLDADLVGLTVITGTAPRAYELAAHFRSRGLTVVLGGPHVTLVPQDAAPHADAIVVGYAEDTWPQLIRDFVAGRMRGRYDQDPGMTLSRRPVPRRDLLPRGRYLTTHVFEATRSCVHSCDFCVAPAAWGPRPIQKPVQDVVADIRQHWARKIVFVDLNLISDRDYAARLFEALIPLGVSWFGLTTTLIEQDRSLLELAVRSGCRGLLMGFESIVPESLGMYHKGFNSPEAYHDLVATLHEHGVTLMACFTFGMDGDTPDVFMRTVRFAVEAGIDLPRFAIVTPFPGTPLYARLAAEGRILTHDWELYDGQHVVFQPANMTPDELLLGHEQAWRYAYGWPSIARRFMGSRIQIPVWIVANLGYRYYSRHLASHYNCDWLLGQELAPGASAEIDRSPSPGECGTESVR